MLRNLAPIFRQYNQRSNGPDEPSSRAIQNGMKKRCLIRESLFLEIKFFVHRTSAAGRVAQVADSSLDNRTVRGVDGIISEKGSPKTNRCSGRARYAQRERVSPPNFGISFTLFAVLADLFDCG